MLHISSRDNPLYKHVKRLVQGRAERQLISAPSDSLSKGNQGTAAVKDSNDIRDDTSGLGHAAVPVVLEGIHLCQDWLRYRGQPERAIFDARRLPDTTELQALASGIDESRIVSMDSALMSSVSPIAKGQGVLFLVSHNAPALPDRIEHACIWLDRIQDPGNVGTLLRTAAAAGLEHAYLSKECANAWSSRVLRSAQGAHFVMTLYEQVDLRQARERLAIPLCATAIGEGTVCLYEGDIPTPCAWVFGNEGQGVEPGLLAGADYSVFIPQDTSVESLNVGVAAGICLFEQRRQQQSRA